MDRVSAEHVGRDGLRQLQPDGKGQGGVRKWFQVPVLREIRAGRRVSGRPVLVVRVPAGGLAGPRVPVQLGPKPDPGVHGRR